MPMLKTKPRNGLAHRNGNGRHSGNGHANGNGHKVAAKLERITRNAIVPVRAAKQPHAGRLLEQHPIGKDIPPTAPPEVDTIRNSIRKFGFDDQQPIVLMVDPRDGQKKILEGWTRYGVCIELKVDPCFVDFDPAWGDPAEWVLKRHTRRNMTGGQKAVWGVAVQERLLSGGTETGERKFALRPGEKASEAAARYVGTKPRNIEVMAAVKKESIERAKEWTAEKLSDPFEEVRLGRMNPHQAKSECKRREKQRKLKAAAAAARKQLHAIDAKNPWEIAEGDALEELDGLDARPRLIFTDPRYNIGLDYGQGKEADQTSESAYLAWCKKWIELCAGILADDGSLCVMSDVRHQADFWKLMQAAKLYFRTSILWWEGFGAYNPATFTPRFRFIHYFTKHATRFVWNADDILVSSARELEYNDSRRVESGMVPPNVWHEFPRVVGNADERMPGFPTQLPLALVERIVRTLSDPGDLVVDPFNGSGTTGAASIRNDRKYFGVDIVGRNVEWSRHRLEVVSAEIRQSNGQKGRS